MEPSWSLYAAVFFGPFVQEDIAVLGAATLSASDPVHFPIVFFIILAGLFFSDIWKYWIGYAAHAHPRAREFAERERMIKMRDQVKANTILTLFMARFIPLARIPAYVACGYFKVSYVKFCAVILLTAFIYTVVIFSVCHWLGEVFGEKLEVILPLVAATILMIFLITYSVKRRIRRRKKNERADG